MKKFSEFLSRASPDIYHSSNYCCLDLETTNNEYGWAGNADNQMLLAKLWYKGEMHTYRGGALSFPQHMADIIESSDFMIAHNAKFEIGWLDKAGLDIAKILVYDTMIGEYVLAGNKQVDKSLDATAQRYGYKGKQPYVDICMGKGVCPSSLPHSLVEDRCEYDVRVTVEVFRQQRDRLQAEGKLPVMLVRCLLTVPLTDIEMRGIWLDAERVRSEHTRASLALASLEDKLRDLAPDVNLNSPKQLAEFLYDTLAIPELTDKRKQPIRSAAGGRKTDKATISALKPRTKRAKGFIELYKQHGVLSAELSKTLNNFKACVDAGDVLYGQFNQTVTVTHRLSSSGRKYSVQFQNFPRKFKPLITARNEGWLVGECDGAQLEFRVAAFDGQDATAVSDIRNKVDVHSYTAKVLTDNGQPTDRQGAKAHTFKPLYGGTSGTPAEQAYYAAFKAKYPGIAAIQQQRIMEALTHKKIRIRSGLEFFFPDTEMTRSGFVTNSQNICNYPVQSLATADIIPIAIVHLWHKMRELKLQSFINNTVHDSTILEIHPDEVDIMQEISVDSFTRLVYITLYQVYGIEFNVPLGTGFKIGTHWGEGHETVTDAEPPTNFEEFR